MAGDDNVRQAQARVLLEQLRQQFLQELPLKIEDIESLLLAYDPQDDDKGTFERLYRQVHSLKGSAGTYGMHIISTVCHILEDYLESVGNKSKEQFLSQVLRFVDLLRDAQTLLEQGKESFSGIEAALAEIDAAIREQPFNILLVTPSKSTQALCMGILEPLPVRISITEDGITALTRLRHEKFDILITAMANPSINGKSLAAATRLSDGLNSHIRIILLSSDPESRNHNKRHIDPDVIIHRNARFASSLFKAVQEIIRALSAHG